MSAHPKCDNGHVCQKPSGRICIERACSEPAGTLWGPVWCPDHDRERLSRITRQLEALVVTMPDRSVVSRARGEDRP